MTARPLHPRLPLTARAVVALARRPDLWAAAAVAGRRLAPAGWWRSAPFLPLPDPAWLHFRLVTAYGGDGDGAMDADELITWLEWSRDFPG